MTMFEWDQPRLAHIWHWFNELSKSRPPGVNGPSSIPYTEILAWSQLCNVDVTPAEIEAIKSVDQTYLAYWYQKNSPEKNISVSDNLKEAALLAKTERKKQEPRRDPPAISSKG